MSSQTTRKLDPATTGSAALEPNREPPARRTVLPFRVGEQIFCPRHGIGVIRERRQQHTLGERREYLTIEVTRMNMRIMLPAGGAARAGLRAPSTPAEADRALAVLASEPALAAEHWRARTKHNEARLSSGRLNDIAEVVRDLAALERTKGLGVHDHGVYRQARALLTGDVMVALDLDEQAAAARIDEAQCRA